MPISSRASSGWAGESWHCLPKSPMCRNVQISIEQAGSNTLDMAEHAARPGRVSINVGDIVTGEDATYGGVVAIAFNHRVRIVDHHAIAAKGAEGNQPIADDIRNGVRLIETLAVAGAHEYGRRVSVDALWLRCLVGKEQHTSLAGGFAEAVPARVAAVEIEALDSMAEVIGGGAPKANSVGCVDGDTAK